MDLELKRYTKKSGKLSSMIVIVLKGRLKVTIFFYDRHACFYSGIWVLDCMPDFSPFVERMTGAKHK
jgi:hypothetical protein